MSLLQEIRRYLAQDLTIDERRDYYHYLQGDQTRTSWIEKASLRRDDLIVTDLRCRICGDWVGIRETGRSQCSKGHRCEQCVCERIRDQKIKI